MISRRALLTTALLSTFATAAPAKEIAYLVDGDTGGPLTGYEEKAKIIRHAKVIIDGLCLSACTMYLRQDWGLNVCYTQSALFGFHKPYMWLGDGPVTGISAVNLSNATWRAYFLDQMPKGVQALLSGKQIPQPSAGDPIDRFLYVKARDLHDSVKKCADGWSTKYKLISVQDITTGIGAQ